MIERVFSRVLLPFAANWITSPTVERVFQSEVEAGVTGAESRGAMRQVPQSGVSWSVLPTTTEQRSRLDEILRAALREGQAATPFWGRGLRVGAGSTGTTLELAAEVPDAWVPVAGDVLWVGRDSDGPFAEEYELITVASVTGHTLELEDAPAAEILESSLVWPVIAGRFTGGEFEAVHGAVGVFKFSVRSNDTRTAMPWARFVGPDPSDLTIADPYDPPTSMWPEPSGLTLSRVRLPESAILGLMYTALVEYEPEPEMADTATMEWSTDLSTWSAVDTNQVRPDPDLAARWQCRLRFREQFWIRASIVVDDETITTPPLLIPALTPEAMMRVIQERREDTGGSQFTWPYSAPAYPADGFYDSTISSLGDTAVAAILESMRQALRTTGFLRNFITVSGTVTANWRVAPRARAFTSEWGVTPGSGFTPPAYDAPLSETGLATAITALNWTVWWDDIARVCLQLYKRLYSPTRSVNTTKEGTADQASGDMKPLILSSGGLGEECQDVYDIDPPTDSSDPFGIRTVIEPTSVTDYAWGQTYNAPGQVRMWFSTGYWYESMDGLTGEKQIYRSAYYNGYDLPTIGVVGQNGLTPYHEWAGDTDIYYGGFASPINIPAREYTPGHGGALNHTAFVSVGVIPYMADEEEVREITIHSGLLDPVTGEPSEGGNVLFTWLDVFNTTSRPLRDLGVEMVARVSWYRSPWPEDGHWDHYLHQPAPE